MGARGKRNPGQLVEEELMEELVEELVEEASLEEELAEELVDLVGEQDKQRT